MLFVIHQWATVLALAAVFGLSALLFGLIWLFSGRRWLRIPGILTWLACAIVAVIGISGATLAVDYRLLAGAFFFGLSLIGSGFVLTLFEVRIERMGKPIMALGAAVGVLISLSALIAPIIPGQLAPLSRITTTLISTQAATPLPTRTPRQIASATLPPTLTPHPTALPSLTYTPLPTPDVSDTPAPTLALDATSSSSAGGSVSRLTATPLITGTPGACTISFDKNVNLRNAPSASGVLLTTIPFGVTLSGTGQSDGWWRVRYRDQTGWVIKDATRSSVGCVTLPDVTLPATPSVTS